MTGSAEVQIVGADIANVEQLEEAFARVGPQTASLLVDGLLITDRRLGESLSFLPIGCKSVVVVNCPLIHQEAIAHFKSIRPQVEEIEGNSDGANRQPPAST